MEDINPLGMNPNLLKELKTTKMPFGKYIGLPIYRLPEPYLVWFNRQGFPNGKLGVLLSIMYEIRLNGLEHLLRPL